MLEMLLCLFQGAWKDFFSCQVQKSVYPLQTFYTRKPLCHTKAPHHPRMTTQPKCSNAEPFKQSVQTYRSVVLTESRFDKNFSQKRFCSRGGKYAYRRNKNWMDMSENSLTASLT
jgi:hypothetical protein